MKKPVRRADDRSRWRADYRFWPGFRRHGPCLEWDNGSKEWFCEPQVHARQYPDGSNYVHDGDAGSISHGPLDLSGFPGYEEAP